MITVAEPDLEVPVDAPNRLPPGGEDEFGPDREVLEPRTAILRASPAAFVRPLGGGVPVREALATTWARYFQNVPAERAEDFEYPIPLSDDFWAIHQEPVADFVASARALVTAVNLVGKEPEAMTTAFEYLLSTVRPALVEVKPHRGPSRLVQLWRSHKFRPGRSR